MRFLPALLLDFTVIYCLQSAAGCVDSRRFTTKTTRYCSRKSKPERSISRHRTGMPCQRMVRSFPPCGHGLLLKITAVFPVFSEGRDFEAVGRGSNATINR